MASFIVPRRFGFPSDRKFAANLFLSFWFLYL